jgi:3-oxoacyl-[acyl-carrier-protein] synthase-3
VDGILVASVTPDMPFPSTACVLQQKLGIATCPCAGIEVGCSGVLYGLELAAGLLARGPHRNILVVAADKLSAVTDWTDRSTCVLLADGACALVVGTEPENARAELLRTYLDADGSAAEFLCMPGGGSQCPATEESVRERKHFLKMNGREVFRRAVKSMVVAVDRIFADCNISAEDVDYFVPHQANMRIIEAIAEYVHLPLERFLTTIERTGNTSSASVGITLDDGLKRGKFAAGNRVLLLAFGAGLTFGATLLRWMR